MADKLYTSHSLSYSKDNNNVATSGSLTLWENRPQSPYNVGDTFQPVPDGPVLTVDKVSIQDSVIGELYGKPVRQWEVNIEGSNKNNSSSTHVIYNFNISENEKSGSMEVSNTGERPAISIAVGSSFSVPGVGNVTCYNVKGSNSFDDNGVLSWTVIYEGSDKEDTEDTIPEVKYNFSVEGTSDDDLTHSGSKTIVSEGAVPASGPSIGSNISVPGLGSVKCTKITGSDDYTDAGVHRWTVTYEGTDASNINSGVDISDKTKYTGSIEGTNSNDAVRSGSKSVVNTGDSPSITMNVGSSFYIPGIGSVKCTKITSSDDYTDAGVHRWTVTYEGTDKNDDENDDDDDKNISHNTKYHFSIEKNSKNIIVHSGSIETVNKGEDPNSTAAVGGNIIIPGIGSIPCTKVSGSDSYDDDDNHLWTVVREGSDDNNDDNSTKYSFSIEKNSDGVTVYSGSREITSKSENPHVPCSIGGHFSVPYVGSLTCTNVKSSSDGSGNWTTIIEGSSSDNNNSLPENETSTSYELNGTTVRTVAGELIVLRRSGNAIVKKNITVYSDSENSLTTPGGNYSGGTVISENVSKETVKENGVTIKTYYKHQIEVEA